MKWILCKTVKLKWEKTKHKKMEDFLNINEMTLRIWEKAHRELVLIGLES